MQIPAQIRRSHSPTTGPLSHQNIYLAEVGAEPAALIGIPDNVTARVVMACIILKQRADNAGPTEKIFRSK